MGIAYFHLPVLQFSPKPLSAWWTLWKNRASVLEIIKELEVEIVMPRSTMPAWLVKMMYPVLRKQGVNILFDADGLPIQERVDFSGLKTTGFQYKMLSGIERFLIHHSDRVLVRTQRAAQIHLEQNPGLEPAKFFKVINGRDAAFFQPDLFWRNEVRASLGIAEKDILLAHSGSLGGAYNLEPVFEMLQQDPRLKLMVLTRQIDLAKSLIPESLEEKVIVLGVPFDQVPQYLSAADVGVCLRKVAPSLQGIAPIKLGEYLMMGLPVLVNPEIGDTQEELAGADFCFFWSENSGADFFVWLESLGKLDKDEIRKAAVAGYSLEASCNSYLKAFE